VELSDVDWPEELLEELELPVPSILLIRPLKRPSASCLISPRTLRSLTC